MLQPNKKIRLLIVDDSAFIRKSLEFMVKDDPTIEVVGLARNGKEAIDLILKLKPDVVTMDVEMPQMNGLEALQQIMKICPTPVIMISSLTEEGAEITIRALELGAVDFIPKKFDYSSAEILKIKKELHEKIHQVAGIRFSASRFSGNNLTAPAGLSERLQKKLIEKEKKETIEEIFHEEVKKFHIIGIASSTGGPMTLQKILTGLPANLGGTDRDCPAYAPGVYGFLCKKIE